MQEYEFFKRCSATAHKANNLIVSLQSVFGIEYLFVFVAFWFTRTEAM
jgi:hypothetical protein